MIVSQPYTPKALLEITHLIGRFFTIIMLYAHQRMAAEVIKDNAAIPPVNHIHLGVLALQLSWYNQLPPYQLSMMHIIFGQA